MKAFPMFIKTTGRRVILVGGGEQAAQKARLMLKTDAQIVFAAAALEPEVEAWVTAGRATWHQGPLTQEFFQGAAMVFVATGCFALDACAHAIAKAAQCQVNVVDQPHLCDITTPSLVDRDPVVVAIGTEGAAPVLARLIKTQLEQSLPQNLGGLAALSGRLRDRVAARIPRSERRVFWEWVFAGKPRALWDKGAEARATTEIEGALNARMVPDAASAGALSIIDAGNSDPELQTLRAVKRLQSADVIFYERRCDEAILELARRDAQRVLLSAAECRTPVWLWNRLRSEAVRGHKVVLLTSRFASDDTELAAWSADVEAADTTFEIIPSARARLPRAPLDPVAKERRHSRAI